MMLTYRPVPCPRGWPNARRLAGGVLGFREVEVSGGGTSELLPFDALLPLYPEARERMTRLMASREDLCGLSMDRPRIMGVMNVTPDSFSDGGRLVDAAAAVAHGMALVEAGADMLDVGGESTRPGAEPVADMMEADRVVPVIEALKAAGCPVPISVDTRKAGIARAALTAGASMFNDVSALTYDPESLEVAKTAPAICLMHAQGDPRTMQEAPHYEDVVAEVYEFLAERVAACELAGISRDRIVVDPGIGFGKTLAHNLALLRNLSAFHGLGCPILLGVSRKGFIGRLSGETVADRRAPGSIAAGLAGLGQGVQILRVHDVAETVQAVRVWEALQEASP
ncbi:MAG: dihydropteroate synthase [Pseudomonadota bacterium]